MSSSHLRTGPQPGQVAIAACIIALSWFRGGVDAHSVPDCPLFGDANGSQSVTSSDIIFVVNFVFKAGPAPTPPEIGDLDCSGATTATDIILLVNYVFKGASQPWCSSAPSALAITAGDAQSDTVHSILPVAISVRVADACDSASASILVRFESPDGQVFVADSITDQLGRASCFWRIGAAIGTDSLRVSSPALPDTLYVTATVTHAMPVSLLLIDGDDQTGAIGDTLPTAFTVQLVDSYGNPADQEAIVFSCTPGGIEFLDDTVLTDSDGIASSKGVITSCDGMDPTIAAVAMNFPSLSASFDAQITSSSFALGFDGIDDFVRVSDAPTLNPSAGLTLEAWVKLTDTIYASYQAPVIQKPSYPIGAYPYYEYSLVPAFDAWTLQVTLDGAVRELTVWWYQMPDSAKTEVGQWYHIAATLEGATMRLYRDGVLIGSGVSTGSLTAFPTPLYFGENAFASYFIPAEIDEIRVWSNVRTQAQIQESMSSPVNPNTPGLSGYWRLEEGTGNLVEDLTGNGNHGQLGTSSFGDAADPLWVPATSPVNGCGP